MNTSSLADIFQNASQAPTQEVIKEEVVINTAGEMIWPLAERENIMMEARRYQTPALLARILSSDLIAVETEAAPRHWEIRKIKR